jgi:hypothetical protein
MSICFSSASIKITLISVQPPTNLLRQILLPVTAHQATPSFAQPAVRQAQMIAPQPQPLVGSKKRVVSDAMAESGPKKPEFDQLLNDDNMFGSFEGLYINLRKYG